MDRSEAPCPAGLNHFFNKGACVVCGVPLVCCRNCRSSYKGREPGTIACGHGVDDGALADGDASKNPIWAVRKYSHTRIEAMLIGLMSQSASEPAGSDDESMNPDDGRTCATFEPKDAP